MRRPEDRPTETYTACLLWRDGPKRPTSTLLRSTLNKHLYSSTVWHSCAYSNSTTHAQICIAQIHFCPPAACGVCEQREFIVIIVGNSHTHTHVIEWSTGRHAQFFFLFGVTHDYYSSLPHQTTTGPLAQTFDYFNHVRCEL